jgi:DNA-binding response OmpR family regulator
MQTILIVDDNLDLCKPMAALFKHMGYNGQYATGGEAALKFVEDAVPDLVILDVMMPGMDGLEVLRRLKADQRTHSVPVVMFSAISDSDFRSHAIERGAADYWVKARVDFSQMRERVSLLLPAESNGSGTASV